MATMAVATEATAVAATEATMMTTRTARIAAAADLEGQTENVRTSMTVATDLLRGLSSVMMATSIMEMGKFQ